LKHGTAIEEESKSVDRELIFKNDAGGMYIWTCSKCQWHTPFLFTDGIADPLEALKDFTAHNCQDHPSRDPIVA
jgi:Zn-finger protein